MHRCLRKTRLHFISNIGPTFYFNTLRKAKLVNFYSPEVSRLKYPHLARAASTASARMFPSPLAAHSVSATRHRSAKVWSLLDLTLGKSQGKGQFK